MKKTLKIKSKYCKITKTSTIFNHLEECRLAGDDPLMYSQFCYYIQQDKQKLRVAMHINCKPAEQVEVDRAGGPAHIIVPDTGEILEVHIFVGVMTSRRYPYVEAFSRRLFQKKDGSRYEIFRDEELPLLTPFPATSYELTEWKIVQYHLKFF